MRHPAHAFLLSMPLMLSACDQLGIESLTVQATRREAEGKAVGAGCRHAGRSVEVCYGNNKKADKAAVFAGWREMNDYMRENKIDAVPPPPEPPKPPPTAEVDEDAPADGKDAKPGKAPAKVAAKAH